MRTQRASWIGIAVLLVAGSVLAQAIPNWSAPPTWTPPKTGMTASTTAVTDLSGPLPFVPVTPCRVADTRGNGFTGAYGPPALAGGATRTFVIGGQCGIPAGAEAVSFNFTILSITTAGDIRVYPDGATMPLVSTQNWIATTGVIANAAITPLGATSGITVHVDGLGTINLIIDVNGYYTQNINSSEFLGIYGNLPSGGVIYGYNASTGGATTSGVRGVVPNGGAGASGVLGEYTGSAAGFGIKGTNSGGASNSAGAYGADTSTTLPTTNAVQAGVVGLSGDGIGVYAVSRNAPVWATLHDGSEATVATAVLGWHTSAIVATSYSGADAGAGAVEASSSGPAPAYGVDASISTLSGSGAGVRGVAGTIPAAADSAWSYAGVRGLGTVWGVLGISTSLGAGGFRHDSTTGAEQSGSYLGYSPTIGLYTVGNTSASGTKSFVEPHPTDPTKEIKYVALEGPEAGTYFRGKAQIVGGQAVIVVPESFRMVTDPDGLTVQVTPIGRSVSVSVVSYDLSAIVVEADKDTEFFYMVNGVRKGFTDFQPIQKNEEFKPTSAQDTMPTALSAMQKRVLVQTGIYKEDGTVNMDNAERLGWAQEWRERDEKLKTASDMAAAKLTVKAAGETESARQP
jgi:hypothetical protein